MAQRRFLQRARSRGSITILMAELALVLFFMMVASIRLGSMALQKEEHQNQADAISLAANLIAMREGVDEVCNHPALTALANGNRRSRISERVTTCPQPRRVEMPDGTTRLTYPIAASDEVNHSFSNVMPLDNEQMRLQSTGSASLSEFNTDTVELRLPKLVLVLDYSGSMRADFSRTTRIKSLRKAVHSLLDLDLRAEYGAVLFSTDVKATVAISPDSSDEIGRVVDRNQHGGLTNYGAAISSATSMLTQTEDTGWYILFVTDGLPEDNDGYGHGCPAEQRGRSAATAAKNNGIGIFSLFIGADEYAINLLKDMSGTRSQSGNDGYVFSVTSDSELQNRFRAIIASILCTIGPLTPEPPPNTTTDDIYVYLNTADGQEIKMESLLQSQLSGAADRYAFSYAADENKVRLTQSACDEVLEHGAHLSVRYGPLQLAQ